MTRSISDDVTQADSAKILAAIELSKTSWVVALHLPSHDKISVFQLPGGDVDRLLAILERARETVVARGVSAVEIPIRMTGHLFLDSRDPPRSSLWEIHRQLAKRAAASPARISSQRTEIGR